MEKKMRQQLGESQEAAQIHIIYKRVKASKWEKKIWNTPNGE